MQWVESQHSAASSGHKSKSQGEIIFSQNVVNLIAHVEISLRRNFIVNKIQFSSGKTEQRDKNEQKTS